MGKNYNDIENALSKRYNGLLSAVSSPDAVERAKTVNKEYKEKEKTGFFDFFRRPAMQYVGVILVAVLVCGGTYLGIMKLNSLNPGNTPDTSDAVTDIRDISDILTIQIGDKQHYTVRENNTVKIDVTLKNVKEIASVGLTIYWDEGLRLLRAEYADKNALIYEPNQKNASGEPIWIGTESPFMFNRIALDQSGVIRGDCVFVSLEFEVTDRWKFEEYRALHIRGEADPNNIFDTHDNNVPFEITGTEIWPMYLTVGTDFETADSQETTDPETIAPDETAVPDDTTAPGETAVPDDTTAPGETAVPDNTTAHDETASPETTGWEDIHGTETVEETETETTVPETTEAETDIETTTPVTEPDPHREFRSVQTSHTTPDSVDKPTIVSQSSPYAKRKAGGVYCAHPSAEFVFEVVDCGYVQYEKYQAVQGNPLPDVTAEYLEKIASGKLKVWLCDLDGNKIDYVYANKNGYVRFVLYPGKYKAMYEDDGTYKTCSSCMIEVEEETLDTGEKKAYYNVYYNDGTNADRPYLFIYNYNIYKPVTIRVKDDATGQPLADTYVVYQGQYLSSSIKKRSRYLKTDKNGEITSNSIFDIILAQDPAFISSWQRDAAFYFEKDGYDGIAIKGRAPTDVLFEIKLHKTEYYEFTIKVIDKETGDPMKDVFLHKTSSFHGTFIIGQSGEDGVLNGVMPSGDLTDVYGNPVDVRVEISYVSDTGSYTTQYICLSAGEYDFTALYSKSDDAYPHGRFEIESFTD